MKQTIEQVINAISEEGNALKVEVENSFKNIKTGSSEKSEIVVKTEDTSIPPVSYFLYGLAGVSLICAFTTGKPILCLGMAALSGWGGYHLSNKKTISPVFPQSETHSGVDNKSVLKNVVSKITTDWETFVEQKNNEVANAINSSSISDSEKQSMLQKTAIRTAIDIKQYEINDIFANLNSTDLQSKLDNYKQKVMAAIDSATKKQIEKYESIISVKVLA